MGSNDVSPVVLASLLVPLALGLLTLFVFYVAKKVSQMFSALPSWPAFGNLKSPSGQATLLGWMALVICSSYTLSTAISIASYSANGTVATTWVTSPYGGGTAGDVAREAGALITLCAVPLGAFFIGALLSGPRLALSIAIPVAALWVSLRVLSDCSWYMERRGESADRAFSASFSPALFSAVGVIAFTTIAGWMWPSSILRSSRKVVDSGPGSPPPPPNASAEPSNGPKILTEADFFRQVAQELKAGKIEEGLWLKARTLTDGSREAAERKYVLFRVSELKADYRRKRHAINTQDLLVVVVLLLLTMAICGVLLN